MLSRIRSFRPKLYVISLLLILFAPALWAAPEVIDAFYMPDTPFPQFDQLWHDQWPLATLDSEISNEKAATPQLGGYVHIYFKNVANQAITVTDLTVEGIKLSEGLGKSNDRQSGLNIPGMSIYLSKLPQDQISRLESAGEPVWWKPEPRKVEPGATGEIVMRLRHDPKNEKVDVGVVTDAGIMAVTATSGLGKPCIESICFSPKLTSVNLYVSYPGNKMIKPEKIMLDDVDVTKIAHIGVDTSLEMTPIEIWLDKPLELMSYHTFRAIYSNGRIAVAGIRSWNDDFAYGMWGGMGDPKSVLTDFAEHNINVSMGQSGKNIAEISLTEDGSKLVKSLDMRHMATWPGNAKKPLFYFLMDEPDAHDGEIDDLQKLNPLGCLAQGLVDREEQIRGKDPKVPILLNLDNTYKPDNYYTYQQLGDVACLDPYYPEALDSSYSRHPSRLAYNSKPTMVYAGARISQSAAAPKPMHVILCSTKYIPNGAKPGDYVGRFPTPEEKRMEVYYSLAAGAKGLSFWWFSPDPTCYGCGANDPNAKALYKEIGLLGAEVRTAGSLIANSSPADIPVNGQKTLMLRTLVSGLDTVGVIAINQDVLCDRVGTVVKPTKAAVTLDVPAWIDAKDAFEIAYDGIKDINWKKDGKKVSMDLGTVDVSRFVIVTSNSNLRPALKKIYDTKFAANVAKLTGKQ